MSTRYNTGNPIESTDVRDMSDNAKNLDLFSNSSDMAFDDRFGVERKTIHGMNSEFNSHILNMGFARIGTFASGATLTNPRQTLLWDIADGGDGQEYGWSGTFAPHGKIVPPSSSPTSTGGISIGAWVSRFDPLAKTQIREAIRRSYAEAGYNLVDGSFEAGGTLVNSNDVLLHEASGKAFSGPAGTVAAGTNPESGGFVDASASLLRDYVLNTTAATFKNEHGYSAVENMIAGRVKGIAGAVVHRVGNIYSTGGTTWKYLGGGNTIDKFEPLNAPTVTDFGVVDSATIDSTVAINNALAAPNGTHKIIPDVACLVTSNVLINNTISVEGYPMSTLLVDDGFSPSEDVLTIAPTGIGNKRLIKIEGISIIPVSGTPARDAIVLDITDAGALLANFEMRRVLTEQTGGYALRLRNPVNVDGFFSSTIEKCKLKGGMFLERVGDSVNILETTISGRNEGIRATGVTGASQVIIEKTNITASGGAIYLEGYIEQCKMRDLQIEQSSPYTGSLPKGKRSCIALIGNGLYVNDQSSIESSNINAFSYADSCIHIEGANGISVRDSVLAVRTASRPIAGGSFEDGGTVTLADEILISTLTGDYYLWDGELPKVVPPGSTPTSSGGIGEGAWLLNADNNGAGNNTNYNQNHIVIRSSCRNVKIYADNTFLSSDTTTNTTPKILDMGVGTCGVTKPLTDLYNGWSTTDTVNFPFTIFKDPSSNRVSINGAIKSGTLASGTLMFKLPNGFAPIRTPYSITTIRTIQSFRAKNTAAYQPAFIQIDGSGAVTLLHDLPTAGDFYLNIEFQGDSVYQQS